MHSLLRDVYLVFIHNTQHSQAELESEGSSVLKFMNQL